MIYKYEQRNAYYAGINYISRTDTDLSKCCCFACREDAWSYYERNNTDRLVYRGVEITKGFCESKAVMAYPTYWQWRDEYSIANKEDYPDDL